MIKTISFEMILPIWKNELWPNRQSKIEPASALDQNGKVDMTIFENIPVFFGYYIDGQIVGVNSCHQTSNKTLRSRGLWVHPDFREQGIAKDLMRHLFIYAGDHKFEMVWSMARQTAVGFYYNLGFTKYADTSEFEFGPHVLVAIKL